MSKTTNLDKRGSIIFSMELAGTNIHKITHRESYLYNTFLDLFAQNSCNNYGDCGAILERSIENENPKMYIIDKIVIIAILYFNFVTLLR